MKQVATEAGAELAKMGLKRRPQLELTPGTVVWTSELINGGPCGVGADVWVEFHAGRVLPPSSPQETNNDPDYTTVCIDTSLDESWLNVVRYTLFSQ